MKVLKFGEGHLQNVESGKKQITLRLYDPVKHSFYEGEVVMGEFLEPDETAYRPLTILQDTEVVPAMALRDSVAQEDGFENAVDAIRGLSAYYGLLRPNATLAIVRFNGTST